MFLQTSMTGVGLAVVIITTVLNFFGIVPAVDQVSQIVGDILTIVSDCAVVVGWLLTIWGQLRRTDLTFGLFRKQ
jgi:nucleoside permease NupC